MSEYLTNEAYARSVRQRVVETATKMLSGDLDFLLGARVLSSIRHEIPKMDADPDFIKFVAIDSETDDLPLGDTQTYWDKNALEELMPKIKGAESWAKSIGQDACLSLIDRFSEHANESQINNQY